MFITDKFYFVKCYREKPECIVSRIRFTDNEEICAKENIRFSRYKHGLQQVISNFFVWHKEYRYLLMAT